MYIGNINSLHYSIMLCMWFRFHFLKKMVCLVVIVTMSHSIMKRLERAYKYEKEMLEEFKNGSDFS